MIFTERNITIRNDSATINAPVILYRGDKNVEVRFILIESPYKYSNRDSINIFESTDASYAQLVIKTPNDREPIFGDITAVGNNNVTFVIRHDMIDEIEEVGKYDFQIRLFDADQTSMATTPEVVGGFIIKEPIAKEDSNNNITNSAIVGSAVVTNDLEIPTFVGSGYNKTAWHDGDVISKQKLNKLENGIYETYELSKDNNSQIKDIEKLKADKTTTNNIQQQVNNLVLGAVGDGNNAEVAQARGSFDTLNERLDFDEEKTKELDTIIHQEIEISEVDIQNNLSSMANEYGVIKGYRVYSDQLLSDNNVYAYCCYIEGKCKFEATNISNSVNNPSKLWTIYSDRDGTTADSYIGGSECVINGTTMASTGIIETPENAKMIVFFKAKSDTTPISITKYSIVNSENCLLGKVSKLEKISEKISENVIDLNYVSDIDDTYSNIEYDFDSETVKARYFAQRNNHRNKYITDTSKTIYWSINNGDDLNDGLSELTPFKTFEKVKTSLVNGDTLLIERGSVIRDLCAFDKALEGILIDAYGDDSIPNPIFDNLIPINTSEVEKVEGYNNIYRYKKHYEAGSGNITNMQCFVDGKRMGDIRVIDGYPNPSNKHITNLTDAMTELESNPNNSAWFGGYENGANWSEGDYYFYFALSDSPTNHIIEITNHVVACLLDMYRLTNYDMRNIDTRGSAGKDGWNVGTNCFLENCNIYDHCHHGFLGFNGFMKCFNCKTESRGGAIGFQFHYFGTSRELAMNEELIFIDCKSISSHQLGSAFDGHMTSEDGKYYKAIYIIDCYAEETQNIVGCSNVKRYFIKNLRINNVGNLGNINGNAIINNIRGTLYKNTKGTILGQNSNSTINMSNVVIKQTIKDGLGGICFTEYPDKEDGKTLVVNMKDCILLIDKPSYNQSIPSLTAYALTQPLYSTYNFYNCVFAVDEHKNPYGSKLINKPSNKATLSNCVLFNVQNNKSVDDTINCEFNIDLAEMKELKWFQRTSYIDNGLFKRAVL